VRGENCTQIQIQNTIVAGNSAPVGADCAINGSTSLGNNLVGDPIGCNILLLASDLTGDPALAALIDDGRPGNGHFPLLGTSPAIDSGNNNACPLTDQIGQSRLDGDGDGQVVCDIGAVEFPVIRVSIDIKPGSDPNCFNNNGHGVIPVAILGSATFDVTQIDASTVSLAGLVIGARGRTNKLLAHIEDVNGDGLDDMVVQIEDVDGTFTAGDGTATLTGNLFDGTAFEGSDEICVTQ
jgi:hypothetical protein